MRFVIQPLSHTETKQTNTFYKNKFYTKLLEEEDQNRDHLIIWNMNSVRERINHVNKNNIHIFFQICYNFVNEFKYNFFLCCIQDFDYNFDEYVRKELLNDYEEYVDEDEDIKELVKMVKKYNLETDVIKYEAIDKVIEKLLKN